MTSLALVDILVIVGITLLSLVVLLLALQFYFSRRATKYDVAHRRVELELMRKAIEAQMYALNEKLLATELRWKDVNHLLVSSQNRQSVASHDRSSQLAQLFSASGVTEDDVKGDPALIFVMTPFHPVYRQAFEAISGACRDMKMNPMRGDEQAIQGEVFPHIFRLIVRARLVVANIDGRNPNVLYELGIAHGLGKPTILVARRPEDVPFDVRARRLVVYSDFPELRTLLRDEIKKSLDESS